MTIKNIYPVLFSFWMMLAGAATAGTVMVSTNGLVYHPENFWVVSGAEQMMIDIAASAIDTAVPDYLSDYYNAAQSDARFRLISSYDNASQVEVARTNLTRITGWSVQQCLESIDALLTNSGGSVIVTNGTNTVIVSGGATNAAQVRVNFNPSEYTPATNTVESHLIAIDAYLDYLHDMITNSAVTNATLTGLTLTGNNLAYEGLMNWCARSIAERNGSP